MQPCRKCGTPNPESNLYCRKCGAVLAVATRAVRAQPRTFIPLPKGFRWRWVGLGVLALLGTATLAGIGLAIAAAALLGASASSGGGSLRALGARAPGFAVAAAAVFLLAFALGGFAVARRSRGRTVAEPALAALVVLGILAATGTAISSDAPLIAAVLALPCAAMAALGGWFGEVRGRGGRAS